MYYRGGMPNVYTTLKVRKRFSAWLKRIAREDNKYIFAKLEELVAKAVKGMPWEEKEERRR